MSKQDSAKQRSLVELAQKAVMPLTVFGIIAGGIVTAVTQSEKLTALLTERPTICGAVVAILLAAFSWLVIGTFGRRWIALRLILAAQLSVTGLLIIAYLLWVSFYSWCLPAGVCHPAKWRLESLNIITTAEASEPALAVLGFQVDASRSSFRMNIDHQSIYGGPTDPELLPSVEFDRRMIQAFQNASCTGVDGEQAIEDALPIWRDILRARGRSEQAARIANYDQYRLLITKGGRDGFHDLVPTLAERSTLQHANPDHFKIVTRWLASCVGLTNPVLVWAIENNSSNVLDIASVDYHVLAVSAVMGGGPQAIEPVDVMEHQLQHAAGTQTQTVTPLVRIPPHDKAYIRIKYVLDNSGYGYTWLLQARFKATTGETATSRKFRIFAAKAPPHD